MHATARINSVAPLVVALLLITALEVTADVSAARQQKKSSVGGRVVTLTDLSFDELVSSSSDVWMIDAFAPWCPACQEMEAAWTQLAEVLSEDGIRVGKIDGTKERGLMQRFQVRHFPSIYHISSGETREYEGERSVDALAAFARGGWRDVEPRRGCSSPVSACGRMLGEVTKVPARFKHAYKHLHDERGWGELSLFAGLLAVPVAVGISFICLLDAYYMRRPLAVAGPPHVHAE